jgi:hypothetical protein
MPKAMISRLRARQTACVLAASFILLGAGPAPAAPSPAPACFGPSLSDEYKAGVVAALRSSTDVWGEQALERPEGPTYENMKHHLKPLLLTRQGRVAGPMTDSQVHYVAFGQPQSAQGRGPTALHVADGSQVLSDQALRTTTAPRGMTLDIGTAGTERYGSCLARLGDPRLRDGYRPVLLTDYRDADGVQYSQESFVARIPGTTALASFVRLSVAARESNAKSSPIVVRPWFTLTDAGLSMDGNRLIKDGSAYLYFSDKPTYANPSLTYTLDLSDGGQQTVYVVRPIDPLPGVSLIAGEAAHTSALAAINAFWDEQLGRGATFAVPEQLVMDAQRNLLIQNLLMTWRYSIGNTYEAFYQPESSDTVTTLGEYGFADVYRTSLQSLLPKSKGPNRRNWEQGEKLSHGAHYYHLTRDAEFVAANTPTYRGYVDDFAAQRAADPNGLLSRQQYSSDIANNVYGVHQQTVAWRGLRDILEVWEQIGRTDLADAYRPLLEDLTAALQAAVDASSVWLPDDALFVRAMLLEPEQTYDPITATTLGGYWNLVAPYAFGSGFFQPGSVEAVGIQRYIELHGGRLLGMTRARDSAANNVYGVQYAQFLADNDQADKLVLGLYGKLAHGMTRNTFVAGESDNVGPIQTKWPDCRGLPGCVFPSPETGWQAGEYYRATYLPPNSASNTMFLKSLRLMLVRETRSDNGTPSGLELAFATPRGWLDDGKHIVVKDAPTLFGPISYTIRSAIDRHQVEAEVAIPTRDPIHSLDLRLRAPNGLRMHAVTLNGHDYPHFDPAAETIDLAGLTGKIVLRVAYEPASDRTRTPPRLRVR